MIRMKKYADIYNIFRYLIWVFVIVFCFSIYLFSMGIYFNIFSNSLPYGLYKKAAKPITRNSLAVSCLNNKVAGYGLEKGYLNKGWCATNIMPVVKRVVGLPGDKIETKGEYFYINGEKYSKCKIQGVDSLGQGLTKFYNSSFVLNDGEYFIVSDYKSNSWDSRYYGPVKVDFVVEPYFLF